MAGNKRPSFLKRQKEQARLARAAEKREARHAARVAKASRSPDDSGDDDSIGSLEPWIGTDDELQTDEP